MSALAEETKDDAPVPPGSPTKRHASASIDVDEEEEARVNKLLASGDAEEEAKDVVAPTLLRAAAAGDPSIDLNHTFRRRDRLYSSFVRPKARCLQNEPPPRRRRGRRAHRSQRLGFEPHIENAAPVFRPRVLSRGRRGKNEAPPRRRRGRHAHRPQRFGF